MVTEFRRQENILHLISKRTEHYFDLNKVSSINYIGETACFIIDTQPYEMFLKEENFKIISDRWIEIMRYGNTYGILEIDEREDNQ